jgi:hypothetical protein
MFLPLLVLSSFPPTHLTLHSCGRNELEILYQGVTSIDNQSGMECYIISFWVSNNFLLYFIKFYHTEKVLSKSYKVLSRSIFYIMYNFLQWTISEKIDKKFDLSVMQSKVIFDPYKPKLSLLDNFQGWNLWTGRWTDMTYPFFILLCENVYLLLVLCWACYRFKSFKFKGYVFCSLVDWCVHFPAYSFLVSSGTFDLLVYTIPDCEVPQEWDETQPCFIANAQELSFQTFSTSLHRMETRVSYKVEWTGIVYGCISSQKWNACFQIHLFWNITMFCVPFMSIF